MQTFKYLACGGGNTVLGLKLFQVFYDHVIQANDVHVFWSFSLTARVATFFLTMCVTFPLGFLLSSYVVFPESTLRGRVQLFRYAVSTASFIVMGYLLTKFFAWATPFVSAPVANIFVNFVTAVVSYFTQKIYTFKSSADKVS